MCGIFGYIGSQQALPILVEGLRRLEYRGYDSTGVSVHDGTTIQTHKTVGKVADLHAILPAGVPGGGFLLSTKLLKAVSTALPCFNEASAGQPGLGHVNGIPPRKASSR